MNTLRLLSVLVGFVCSAMTSLGAESSERPTLDSQLEPFRPLLEKTWKGEFKNSQPDRPVVDIMRWERALNGKAIRVMHSINDGAYGGETIFRWDEKKQQLTYHYFTTAGFMTVGSLKAEDGKLVTHEVVEGSPGGVTEVRATSQLLGDGTFRVKSEHRKDGQWSPGRDVTYREDPQAKVIFK
jgi:hypothetical protein